MITARPRFTGRQVLALRQRLQLTQEDFARAIGVTVSSINRWEKGHISPSRLACEAMDRLAREVSDERSTGR